MVYQLMFAIITPALITGATAERMKFSGTVLFLTLWFLVVYAPLAHMVWGKGGLLMRRWEENFRRWTLRAARLCTFPRAFRRWYARCISASVPDIPSSRCHRIAWC